MFETPTDRGVEEPADAAADNVYEIIVTCEASDGGTLTTDTEDGDGQGNRR